MLFLSALGNQEPGTDPQVREQAIFGSQTGRGQQQAIRPMHGKQDRVAGQAESGWNMFLQGLGKHQDVF